MVSVPSDVYNAVEPIAQQYGVPDTLWENIAYYESNLNPRQVGDGPQFGGWSYGLFQLHVADNGAAQGNTALNAGYSVQDLMNPAINAKFAMPSIAAAWKQFGPSFNNNLSWWTSFLAASGHPGGNANDPITQQYAQRFSVMYNKGLFGSLTPGQTQQQQQQTNSSIFDPLSMLGLPTAQDVASFVQRYMLVMFGGLLVVIGVAVIFFKESS